ncbi:peptidyl-prolyl cis-trans isomerase [candidate division WOR-3 bacterium]|nr:peptidyl-prolyl cis-trans isomerase [candidate division WOR-3 bacterium]
MDLLLILLMGLPQDYVTTVLEHEYEEALTYCEQMVAQGKNTYEWTLETGDLYLDKLNDFEKAVSIYQGLVDQYPKKDGWLRYRLAVALEMSEEYLNSAKAYEIVATQYRKPPLDSFALSGVERCFKKNYQDPVAVINGQTVTRLEFDEFMAKMSPFAKKDPHAVLDQMILQILIYQSACEHGIDGTENFKRFIGEARNAQLLDEVYAVEVLARATPAEKEIKKYYKKNKENYLVREQIRAKEIIVESDSLARILLDSLHKDIANFDTLAKQYSTASSAQGGGYTGIIYKDVRPEPIDKALFKADVNTLIDIIEYDGKYGIYTVTEHRPARYRELEEVQTQIESTLKAENLANTEAKFMKDLRKKASIDMFEGVIQDTTLQSMEKVVAKVNGREILKKDVIARNEIQPQFGKIQIDQPEAFKELLSIMIDEDLKLEYGERNKYFLNDGYIAKMLEQRTRFLENGLYNKVVVEGVTVDSAEVRAYYDDHREEFLIPESVTAKEIVVHVKQLAEDLRKQLLADPALFDSLAQVHSKAINANRGGLTGALRRGMRPKVFDDIAFAIKINTISKVFATDDTTFNIITVIERTPSTYRSFEEVQPSIEMNILRRDQRAIADAFLNDLKENAEIEIMLEREEEGSEALPEDLPPDLNDADK